MTESAALVGRRRSSDAAFKRLSEAEARQALYIDFEGIGNNVLGG